MECKKEAPDLQKAYQTYRGKGVQLIGAFVKSGDDDIKKFAETYKLTFPVGKDNGIQEKLGVHGRPVTVFIDKKGTIVKRHIGLITYEQLVSNIEALLK